MAIQQPESWDAFSTHYEAFAEPMTLRFGLALSDALAIGPGDEVLDVAAGSGGLSLVLARRGARVTAIDHSPAMARRIAERAEQEGVALTALAMDGQALDFADASFDVALSVFGVMMFPDHEAGLRELVRVLRPGGRGGLAVWQSEGGAGPALLLRAAAQSLFPDRPLAPMPIGHQVWRDPDRLATSWQGAGLTDVEVIDHSLDWPMPTADWVADNADRVFGVMPIWSAASADERTRLLAHIVDQMRAMTEPAVPSPAWLAIGTKL